MHPKQHFMSFVPAFAYAILTYGKEQTAHLIWRHEAVDISAYLISDDVTALLLLYDVTNKASFDNIKAWLTEIHEFAQQNVVIMLLGNKADATHERVVKREEGEKLAKEFGVPFMETSAKSGLNVELAFTAVAKELKHREMKEPNEPKFQLQEYVNKEMKGVGCCRS
uniref:RAB26, member RAS oncogene family n=1 Tax=Cyprinus carpio TaxID=7962 RepID=A0A8C2GWM3_CYPCA